MSTTADPVEGVEPTQGKAVTASTNSDSMLDRLGKVVALIASISLPLSIVFDFGFYQAIGVDMRDVPTSIADHARSAVVWLPIVMGAWWVFGLGTLFDHRMTRGMTPNELHQLARDPVKAAWRSVRYWFWIRVLCSVFIVAYVLFGSSFEQPAMAVALPLWLWFAPWCMDHANAAKRWSVRTQQAVIFIPVVVVLFFSYGRNEGDRAMKEKLAATIYYANPALPPVTPVTILRYTDKGILVKRADGHVAFYQWTVIASVDGGPVAKSFSGLLCSWFNWCAPTRYLERVDQGAGRSSQS